MKFIAGCVILGTYMFVIGAVVFFADETEHNPLFHQLLGMVEGSALTIIGYNYGSTSSEKNELDKKQ